MIRRVVIVVALFALPLVAGAAAELTVLSYNVRSARGGAERPEYRDENLEALVAMIAEFAPDVVMLQELDRGVERSNRVDQFDFIVERTGMAGRFARTVDYQGGRFGIALLTRHAPVSYDEVRIPRLGGKEPRALQHMRIRLADGTEVDLFNTHIDPRLISRDQQIAIVLDEATARRGERAVLGGDFNATPRADSIREILSSWQDAAAGGAGLPTFPARAPRVRVDYLFFAGEAISLDEFGSPDHRGISDHTPLLARFELSPD